MGETASSVPPIKLQKLWSNNPHRCVVAASGMKQVNIAVPAKDATLSTFNNHAMGLSTLVKVNADYYHASGAHCVFVIESADKDLKEMTISLQRGDRSAAQAKLNGKLLKAEKRTPVKPGDLLSLPGVDYRVTRDSQPHS